MHANFEKRKVPQAGSGNFALKWLFYKIYALYNIYSFICGLSFWKTRLKSFMLNIGLSQGKFTFTKKIYWTAFSITITLHQIFRIDILKYSYFWLVIEKSTKFIKEN